MAAGAGWLAALVVVVLLLIVVARAPVSIAPDGGRYPPGTRFVG